MRAFFYLAAVLAAAAASAQTPAGPPQLSERPAPRPSTAAKGPQIPFQDESLRYAINWPSGLSLGEAQMQASRSQDRWSFALSLDASVPGFAASDSYLSLAGGDFCSAELTKRFTHGKKKGDEKTTFDTRSGTATRQSIRGGKSEITISTCPRDALSFLYYVRRELAEGRLPGPQTVYFGAPYQVRLEFGGRQTVRVNDLPTEADRVTASLKGPASQSTVEMYFSRDAARTPVLVRIPLAAGSFTMELVR